MPSASTEASTDTASVARAYFDAIRRRDLDGMVAVWEPGSTDRLNGMADLSVPEGLRDWFGSLFAAFPDFRMEVVDLVVEGESAAVRWHATGTFDGSGQFEGMDPTGATVDITGFDLLTIRDGRVQHNEAYVNGAHMAQQLGALPESGSMQERAMTGALNLKTRLTQLIRRQTS